MMKHLSRWIAVLVLVQAGWARSAERPNILVVYLDDFGWRDCGFMGTDFYETPHLDALASRGMVFTNAYSSAANCAPARASLMTGQYSPRHEIYNVGTKRRGNPKHGKLKHIPGTDTLRQDIRTWATQIHDAGYRTGTIGKWHLSSDPIPYGFDFNFAGTHGGGPPGGYFPPHRRAPGLEDAPEGDYLTDRLTDEAIGFMGRNRDRPWLLYLAHFAVHVPLQGKADLIQKYQDKPAGELHHDATMAAMIESVDDGIGRIVAALDQWELDSNTIIVFTSDNGGYGPATSMNPLYGYKGTYFEGGIREPFVVVWPGVVKPGSTCETPVIQIDLFPTLCEMAGASLPHGQVQDGRSLMPLLTGDGDWEDRPIFWHFPAYLESYKTTSEQRDPLFRSRPCSVIRRGDWKLHEYFEDSEILLFNLQDDIGESNDLSKSSPVKAKAMHEELIRWRQEVNAPVPSQPNPMYDADAESSAMNRLAKKASR